MDLTIYETQSWQQHFNRIHHERRIRSVDQFVQVLWLKFERINQVLPWPVGSEQARAMLLQSIENGELGPVTVLESAAEELREQEFQVV